MRRLSTSIYLKRMRDVFPEQSRLLELALDVNWQWTVSVRGTRKIETMGSRRLTVSQDNGGVPSPYTLHSVNFFFQRRANSWVYIYIYIHICSLLDLFIGTMPYHYFMWPRSLAKTMASNAGDQLDDKSTISS